MKNKIKAKLFLIENCLSPDNFQNMGELHGVDDYKTFESTQKTLLDLEQGFLVVFDSSSKAGVIYSLREKAIDEISNYLESLFIKR